MLQKSDIISEYFDENLYMQIRTAREAENKRLGVKKYPTFEDLYPDNGKQINHMYEGSKLYDNIEKRIVTIDSVYKHWYHGWYVMALFYTEYEHFGKTERLHGQILIENINCKNDTILNSIKEDQFRFTFIKNSLKNE
jgi:hypothetical protein